jgi:hypothetical protein
VRCAAEPRRACGEVVVASAERINHPVLLIGYLNTGLHRRDELGPTLLCSDKSPRLGQSGWADAWRHFHGLSRAGNRCRSDHAFVMRMPAARLRACRYAHQERDDVTTDRSRFRAKSPNTGLMLQTASPGGNNVGTGRDVFVRTNGPG